MKILLLPAIICFFFVIGCKENTTDALLDTYQQRLTNILGVEPDTIPSLDIPRYPRTHALKQPIADITIGLLNAYELRQCGLFQLIAERNSVLGKVQDKTRRLHYELLFLKQIEHCLNVLNNTDPLQLQLKDIYHQKQQQLPRAIWNMVFTGQEWQQQFTLGHQLLSPQQFGGYIENLAAFEYLDTLTTTMLSSQTTNHSLTTNNIDQLLHHQQQIHNTQYIGQLFYSIARITIVMNTITSQLITHDQTVMCGKNINQQQAQYLRNVFYKYYINDIQPYISKLHSQYQQLRPHLNNIYTVLVQQQINPPTAMAIYARYYFQGELLHQFQQVTHNHVRYWQRFFKRCQFKVGHQ
ncbi:DUF3080 domain-containing protein [Photobacterium piscicola]|uniref:DUF3080 domain-containing protein n=1 Tax=Photobacterium piscicola TaxID=1378299 RepID=UPI00373706EC